MAQMKTIAEELLQGTDQNGIAWIEENEALVKGIENARERRKAARDAWFTFKRMMTRPAKGGKNASE